MVKYQGVEEEVHSSRVDTDRPKGKERSKIRTTNGTLESIDYPGSFQLTES